VKKGCLFWLVLLVQAVNFVLSLAIVESSNIRRAALHWHWHYNGIYLEGQCASDDTMLFVHTVCVR
jgi:hypothetical protein